MTKKEITIGMEPIMDASPIALLVQTANSYGCATYLTLDGMRINAKSIMGMMSMPLVTGANIIVETDGTDEKEANKAIADFLMGK